MIDLMFYHNKEIHVHYNKHLPKRFNEFSINDIGEGLCFMQNETSNATIFGHIGEMTESDYKDSGNQDITIQNLMDMSFMQGYEIVGIHN